MFQQQHRLSLQGRPHNLSFSNEMLCSQIAKRHGTRDASNIKSVQVGQSGSAGVCGDVLQGTLQPCSTDVSPVDSTGPVQVLLPTATAIDSLAATSDAITCTSNAAALPPVSLPVSSTLVANVSFSDGSVRSIGDSRAVFEIFPAAGSACALIHDTAARTVTVTTTGNTCASATCTVSVSFPSLDPSLSASTDITVVVADSMTVQNEAYDAGPFCSSLTPAPVTTPVSLDEISCSPGDFQQASVCALLALSSSPDSPAGSTVDVTQFLTLQMDDPAVALLLPNLVNGTISNRVRPISSGTTNVRASFGPLSAMLALSSGSVAVQHVQAFSFEFRSQLSDDDQCTFQCQSTLAGEVGFVQALDMSVTLSDGYVFNSQWFLGPAAASLDIVDVTNMFQFSSSNTGAITVSPVGELELVGNAAEAVSLQASTTCTNAGQAEQLEVNIYSNLQPELLDVDVGALFGPALQRESDGSVAPEALQVRAVPQCREGQTVQKQCSGDLWLGKWSSKQA